MNANSKLSLELFVLASTLEARSENSELVLSDNQRELLESLLNEAATKLAEAASLLNNK